MDQEEIDDKEQDEVELDDGGQRAVRNRKRNSGRKLIGNLKDNIVGALQGNAKDIFVLKMKAIFFVILAVLIIFVLIVEAVAEDTSTKAKDAAVATFSESTSKAAELFKSTGSLILATDDELDQIKKDFFAAIKDTNRPYYKAFNTKYKNKDSVSVANKVKHITTNFESDETAEVDQITATVKDKFGAVSPKDNRTIYDHILRTEKYNFNNIIWRSFVKSGGGVAEASIDYTVDSDTGLKYPKIDTGAVDGDTYDLEFFINKMRPFLQTWYIPFDIIIGTEDAQSKQNLNTDLAYEIITSAYHEIVSDRYKLEELNRTTNYLVYDKTTTTKSTTRKCAYYKLKPVTTVERRAGEPCTEIDYNNGLCVDYNLTYDGGRRYNTLY